MSYESNKKGGQPGLRERLRGLRFVSRVSNVVDGPTYIEPFGKGSAHLAQVRRGEGATPSGWYLLDGEEMARLWGLAQFYARQSERGE